MRASRQPARTVIALAALAATVAGCGTSSDAAQAASPTSVETPEVEIVAVDYAFQGVPPTVAAGTRLTFRNAAAAEPHEVLIFRIADEETRPVAELVTLPPNEAGKVTTYHGFAVALPGEEPYQPDGDIVLDTPGRYALVCFLPVGADPEVLRTAIEAGAQEQPEGLGDGPPHVTQGMFAEVRVP
jgi:plastocyanin